MDNIQQFLGKDLQFGIGVVESIDDPLTLGRVKVRIFGRHSADRDKTPTIDLPWATVLQQSASTSGIGFSPNYLKPSSWVFVLLLDGDECQNLLVIGALPRLHEASAPESYVGNSGAGYRNESSIYSGDPTIPNSDSLLGNHTGFVPQPPINPSGGSVIRDDGSVLSKQNIPHWPLKVYKPTPSRGDYGLACKDKKQSLHIHYATALALEELGRRFGTYPRITSAFRTPSYNAGVGGAKKSLHVQGRAFDIPYNSIGGNSRGNLAKFAQTAVQCGFTGFGLYNSFIHIDTGTGRVWNGAKAAWFVNAIKAAGWYNGKPGLQDVRTNGVATSTDPESQVDPMTTGSTGVSSEQEMKRQAIKNIESSGGNYSARGPVIKSGRYKGQQAMGAYQIMPGNLPEWSKAALGYTVTESQFMASPAIQDAIFDHRFGVLEQQTGSSGRAAQAWYGGLGGVDKLNKTDGGPMTIGQYEKIFNKHMADMGGKGYIATAAGNNQGFGDPSGSLPLAPFHGKPSTHHNAMGLNATLLQPELAKNNDARLTTFPNAGDKGTIGEPPISESPQYPFNFMYASLSGHLWEYDDTPGVERVNMQHKTGSRLVMGSGGTTLLKSMGNMYSVAAGDSYTLTMGSYKLAATDDIDVRSTADMTIHADGTMNILVRNDQVEHISGKKDILVGETLQIKANRIIIEAENIDFVASQNITMEAGGSVSIRAGETLATSAKDTKSYSSGSFDADASSLKWLEGEAKELPEFTGKSTDLGKAPARAKVEKKPLMRSNPDATPSNDEAYAHYSQNDPTERTA